MATAIQRRHVKTVALGGNLLILDAVIATTVVSVMAVTVAIATSSTA